MTILLNKWDGREFEHNHIRCDFCRRHGAIKRLIIGDCVGHICKHCLLDMVAEIDRAVLEAAIKPCEKDDLYRLALEYYNDHREEILGEAQ